MDRSDNPIGVRAIVAVINIFSLLLSIYALMMSIRLNTQVNEDYKQSILLNQQIDRDSSLFSNPQHVE